MTHDADRERAVQLTAEGWHGPRRHTFGANRLCMWFPKDPPDRQWNRGFVTQPVTPVTVDDASVTRRSGTRITIEHLCWRARPEWVAPERLPAFAAVVEEIEHRLRTLRLD